MTYTVKPGDTLSKIAALHGITLNQLLDANPQFKANPNKLQVGDVLNLHAAVGTAPTQPLPTQPLPSAVPAASSAAAAAIGAVGSTAAAVLGNLSAKYETGGRGPGVVSTGAGDFGGVSYGSYQMASKTGTVAQFVSAADFPWRASFQGLQPGSPYFTAKWKEIAAAEPERFQECQHAYIKRTHFDVLCGQTLTENGLDITKRSPALQDVVWSTAVQHGGKCAVIRRALSTLSISRADPDFDKKLIIAIYAERGRVRADGKLAYFPSSSPNVQKGVASRFKSEQADALKMLADEG
ncbi:MAG TPA: LysM domain-containing protein [Pyrinomonadaceae bacterium]|nr:LysM domain-containing protein [Pyrinomonadaceae bacterium]